MHEGRYDYFSDEDRSLFIDSVKNGAAAVFLYARTVLYDGTLHLFDEEYPDVRAIARSSVVLVPECFFEKYFGVRTKKTDTCIQLQKNGHTLCATAEKSTYILCRTF